MNLTIKMEQYTKENQYLEAQKRVKLIKAFYNHVVIFIIFNLIAFAVNWYVFENIWFSFFFFTLTWGMGLAINGFIAYDWNPFLKKGWKERKIKEILDQQD